MAKPAFEYIIDTSFYTKKSNFYKTHALKNHLKQKE